MTNSPSEDKYPAFKLLLQQLAGAGKLSATTLIYATALGAIATIGGASFGPEFQLLFQGVGMNMISGIIERVARGESISNDQLRQEIEEAVTHSGIERLLTADEFHRAVARLVRGQKVLANRVGDLDFDITNELQNLLALSRDRFLNRSEVSYPLAPFIAHPYTLLSGGQFVGRTSEIEEMNSWVTDASRGPTFVLCAIGGMGKSALAWHWFNNIAPEIAAWDGRIWWSFYNRHTSLDGFVSSALAYVSGMAFSDVNTMPREDRERELIEHLRERRVLIVLDGLERLTVSYNYQPADDDTLDEVAEGQLQRKPLAAFIDPRDGQFLVRLSDAQHSRTLITSRIIPNNLYGYLRDDEATVRNLGPLTEQDAMQLWDSLGLSGQTKPGLFDALHHHPLLIKMLGNAVMQYRPAPRNLARWLKDHEKTPLLAVGTINRAVANVLKASMHDLTRSERRVLETLSSSLTAVDYRTLVDLTVKKQSQLFGDIQVLNDEQSLISTLDELEQRALIGWDTIDNCYGMHPIVRDFIWNNLAPTFQRRMLSALGTYYGLLYMLQPDTPTTIVDVAAAIEFFNVLIRLGYFTDAWRLVRDVLGASLIQLGEVRHLFLLLRSLSEAALEYFPPFDQHSQVALYWNLCSTVFLLKGDVAAAYDFAVNQLASSFLEEDPNLINSGQIKLSVLATFRGNLALGHRLAIEGLRLAQRRLDLFNQSLALIAAGISADVCGREDDAEEMLIRGVSSLGNSDVAVAFRHLILEIEDKQLNPESLDRPIIPSNRSLDLLIRWTRVMGLAEIGAYNVAESMSDSLQEIAAGTGYGLLSQLSELAHIEVAKGRENYVKVRRLIQSFLEDRKLGRNPFIRATLLNDLALIEVALEEFAAAANAASQAYLTAWCDGPPYCIQSELDRAEETLYTLKAQKPEVKVAVSGQSVVRLSIDTSQLRKHFGHRVTSA